MRTAIFDPRKQSRFTRSVTGGIEPFGAEFTYIVKIKLEKWKTARFTETDSASPLFIEYESTNSIVYDGRAFELNRFLTIEVRRADDLYVFENELLGIVGYGKTRDEARDAFNMEFACCWDSVAMVDDAAILTPDAERLGNSMRNRVLKITVL